MAKKKKPAVSTKGKIREQQEANRLSAHKRAGGKLTGKEPGKVSAAYNRAMKRISRGYPKYKKGDN